MKIPTKKFVLLFFQFRQVNQNRDNLFGYRDINLDFISLLAKN